MRISDWSSDVCSSDLMVEIGDYAFVHAGIKPGVPLAEQKPEDLRWIRDEFLSSRKSHEGKIVVHGHTIMLEVDEHPNRIGIDTGAYHSGRLTAICLPGPARWYLRADERRVGKECVSEGRYGGGGI